MHPINPGNITAVRVRIGGIMNAPSDLKQHSGVLWSLSQEPIRMTRNSRTPTVLAGLSSQPQRSALCLGCPVPRMDT